MRIRLVGLQMASKVGDFEGNAQKAEALLLRLRPLSRDIPTILVFPELALSGYAFASREEIEPHLEVGSGRSLQWATRAAKLINGFVALGYPEREGSIIYNSAGLCSPNGLLHRHRKVHLFETDKKFCCTASPGGFQAAGPWTELPLRVQMGICMDLNPYEFKAPFRDYEFANTLRENRTQLILCCMAWLRSAPGLVPYLMNRVSAGNVHTKAPIPVIFANKCGRERDAVYAGCTSVWGNGVCSLGEDTEGLVEMVCDVNASV